MDLIAYRFDCCPIVFGSTGFKDMDEQIEKEANENFDNRLDIIDELFGADTDIQYELADRHAPFKTGSDLVLRRYKLKAVKPEYTDQEEDEYAEALKSGDLGEAQKHVKEKAPVEYMRIPKSQNDDTMAARVIYHKKGVTVLRIQKKRPITGEDKNYQKIQYNENYASSLVILICQEGKQYILIEDTRRTFAPATVSLIMESTLNRLLMTKYHMMCTVNPIRRLSDFWALLNEQQQKGKAIMRLRFKFDYPNMPWNDKLLGFRFKGIGRDLEAEAEVIIKGHHGAPLRLNTKEGERNEEINDLMKYSCDKGNLAYAYYDDKTMTTFGNQQTGSVKIGLPDELGEVQKPATLFPVDQSEEIDKAADKIKKLNA